MTKMNFRRYTDLPALIHLLSNSEITLLDPATWDDKNDSYFLAQYKEKKRLKSVLALCFTSASETYHHWRVFSSGTSGVCIHFNGEKLRKCIRGTQGLTFKKVTYKKVKDLEKRKPTTASLPFIKRYPFRAEKEFRALWESNAADCNHLNIPIDLKAITRITLSPWLHPSLRKNTVSLLRGIDGCKSIPIYRSTLTGNTAWQEYGKNAI